MYSFVHVPMEDHQKNVTPNFIAGLPNGNLLIHMDISKTITYELKPALK